MTMPPRFGVEELKHIFEHAIDEDIRTALEELNRAANVCSTLKQDDDG
jgi:hypothetical protein